jgi:hypothetical protein
MASNLPSLRTLPVSTITMLFQGQRVAQFEQPMQVAASIVTSSVETSRRIAPVGQSTRHTGSVH